MSFKNFADALYKVCIVLGISAGIAIVSHEYSDLFESFVILFIVFMNALIGVFQEGKAESALNELKKLEFIWWNQLLV